MQREYMMEEEQGQELQILEEQTKQSVWSLAKQRLRDIRHALSWKELRRRFRAIDWGLVLQRNSRTIALFGLCSFFSLLYWSIPSTEQLLQQLEGRTSQGQQPIQRGALISENHLETVPEYQETWYFQSEELIKRLQDLDPELRLAYIKRFAQVAQDEGRKYQIPAEVVLGLAILASEFGTADYARYGQNETGILCNWNPLTEGITGQGDYGNFCFTHYETSWASFRANSMRLSNKAYEELHKQAAGNYLAWASGLEKLGFEALNFSAHSLIYVIDTYDLSAYVGDVQTVAKLQSS